MTKVSDILLKVNKCQEIELLCDHKKLTDVIVSLEKLISQLKEDLQQEIQKQEPRPSLDLYKYIEKAKAKIAQYSKEKKDLESQELLLVNKIKEHLSEGRRYEHLKEIQLKEYLSLYANLTNKEENEHSNLRHIFNDRRATKQ